MPDMGILITLLINAFTIFLIARFLPGVSVDTFWTALVVAVILGLVNTIIKPILVLLTLPITILTLGLFYFVINAVMVLLVDLLIPGFSVSGFLSALIFSLLVSIVGSTLNSLVK